jgi:hypothetical protein
MRSADCIVDDKAMESLHSRWEQPSDEVCKLYDEVLIIGPNFISPELKK